MNKLIIIYNAKSGPINGAIDFAHKTISPNTYKCDLCKITYGNFGMKNKWRDFLKGSDFEIEFLHKNQLVNRFQDIALPAIIIQHDTEPEVLISAPEFKAIETLEELIEKTKNKLEHHID